MPQPQPPTASALAALEREAYRLIGEDQRERRQRSARAIQQIQRAARAAYAGPTGPTTPKPTRRPRAGTRHT